MKISRRSPHVCRLALVLFDRAKDSVDLPGQRQGHIAATEPLPEHGQGCQALPVLPGLFLWSDDRAKVRLEDAEHGHEGAHSRDRRSHIWRICGAIDDPERTRAQALRNLVRYGGLGEREVSIPPLRDLVLMHKDLSHQIEWREVTVVGTGCFREFFDESKEPFVVKRVLVFLIPDGGFEGSLGRPAHIGGLVMRQIPESGKSIRRDLFGVDRDPKQGRNLGKDMYLGRTEDAKLLHRCRGLVHRDLDQLMDVNGLEYRDLLRGSE